MVPAAKEWVSVVSYSLQHSPTCRLRSNLLFGSTLASTFVLQFEPEVGVRTVSDVIARTTSLAAGTTEHGMVQITPHGAFLWSDLQSNTPSGSWDAAEGEELVGAQIYNSLAVVARRNGTVDVLEASASGLQLVV